MRYSAILLPGVQLNSDGSPDKEMIERARVAAACYREKLADRIIACGGRTGGAPVSEAEAMARLLRGFGIPDWVITREDQSLFTPDNVKNAAALLGVGAPVLVVTSDYHMGRVLALCRRAGLNAEGRKVRPSRSRAVRHRRRLEWLYRIDLMMGWHDGARRRPEWVSRLYYSVFPNK